MKIVFLDAATIGGTSLDPIAKLGELVCYPLSSHAEALERVGDCEVLIINKVVVDRELMEHAPKLRLICEAATGVNNIDLAEAQTRGIPVCNVAGYSTDSVVQTTFMHMLSLLGNAQYYDANVKNGNYSRSGIFSDVSRPWIEMKGKILGIIGMGTIGQKVAEIAKVFGMTVCYYSTSKTSHNTEYPSVSLELLMSRSDVISIHAPLNDNTRGLIGEKEIAMMKADAIILNTGRGGIIDESALARAIDNEAILGAGIDVYETEPLPSESPLLRTRHPERLRFSPHSAWASQESLRRLISAIAENIKNNMTI